MSWEGGGGGGGEGGEVGVGEGEEMALRGWRSWVESGEVILVGALFPGSGNGWVVVRLV